MFKKQENTTAPTSLRPAGNSVSSSSSAPKSETSSKPGKSASSQPAYIGPSIKFKGDITGDEDLVINGEVAGSVNLPNHLLRIGKSGKIDADVSANIIEIEGHVSGTVEATDLIKVLPSAVVNGNIASARVILEDGCQFKGGIDMKEAPPAEKKTAAIGSDAAEETVKASSDTASPDKAENKHFYNPKPVENKPM